MSDRIRSLHIPDEEVHSEHRNPNGNKTERKKETPERYRANDLPQFLVYSPERNIGERGLEESMRVPPYADITVGNFGTST